INSKVAFKAAGKGGKGIDVSGAVIDQKNDTVAKFKSLKFGMGNFSFTPGANNTYKAVVRSGSGAPVIKDLPSANAQGYVMQLADDATGQLKITVTTNINSTSDVYLFAHTREAVKSVKQSTFNNGTATFTIDKNTLGDGISQLTIFNG